MSTPPTQRMVFETADADAARDHIAETFAEHQLDVGNDGYLNLRLDLALAPRLSIGRMSYGTDTFLDAPPLRSFYHVNLPLTGHSTVRQNGIAGEARAGRAGVAFLPTGPLQVSWSPDQEQYVLKLPKEQLEAHAAKLTGRPSEPIDFDLTFDIASAPGQALLSTVSFVHAELIRPGGISSIPTACHELESAVMTQLLTVVPSQLTQALTTPPASVRRKRIQDVLDLIDTAPAADLTTAELAAKAGVSARALQIGFHELVGMTPTAYIRGVRLDRVHYELLSGAHGSVTDIAMRWGFYHPGRFSAQYRERFGNLPSETVRGGGELVLRAPCRCP